MTYSVFDIYSCYYDLLYNDKDYAAEVDYIHELLKKNGINKGDLLEFGSGTGKHGRILADMGYRVHGIERSPKMVALTKVGGGFTCQQGDICAIQMGLHYDAVLSLFHVVSYQTSNDDVRSVFARAADHLENGGLFLFDVWYSPAVYAQQPEVRVKRMSDEKIDILRIAEPVLYPNENRVDVHYSIYATERATGHVETMIESHAMRHFSLPEIDLLAQSFGFERIAAEEFLTKETPSEKTWGVCIILQKV